MTQIELTSQDLERLSLFYQESEVLADACIRYLKHEMTTTTGTIFFDAPFKLYQLVDPIIERGLVATIRLFMGQDKTRTLRLPEIISIVRREYVGETSTQARLLEIKRQFNSLEVEHREVLDRFWNVTHLHIDMTSDPARYTKQFNARHGCVGPVEVSLVFSCIEQVAALAQETCVNFVRPILEREELLQPLEQLGQAVESREPKKRFREWWRSRG